MEANTVAKSEAGGVCRARATPANRALERALKPEGSQLAFDHAALAARTYNVISRRARHIEQLHIAITAYIILYL